MKQPIKILHIMPHIGTGGAERQLYELIVHSDPELMQHEVLYYSDSRDVECYRLYDEGRIIYSRIPRNTFRPLKFLWDLSREIRNRNPDVVHCWLESGNFWGRCAAILSGNRPVIVAWRNCNLVRLIGMRICERLTSSRVSHLANSHACANYIADKLGISISRFTVVYNGLDIAKFKLPDQRKELFGHLNIPESNKIVTMVGRLAPQKNYPMLIRVANKIKQRNMPLHFMIAGTGDLLNSLSEMARQHNVEDRIHFLGVRNDIPRILTSSDMFLFTSNFEGFPNALLEAMATRLPIVTTNFQGADELIEDGKNGIIVPMNDIEAVVNSLCFYLENVEMATQYGQKAFEFVESAFSMGRMVEHTEKLYRELLDR